MVYEKSQFKDIAALARAVDFARGVNPVPTVIHNAQWLDVFTGAFRSGDVAWAEGCIVGVGEGYEGNEVIDGTGLFLVPGFIDSHVHIESSLMTPARFQELVLPTGTTTAIWDPHEIANVWGLAGIDWALAACIDLLLDVFVMIPSCVPSTNSALGFETSGAELSSADLNAYKNHPKVLGLAEMMNFPGLLHKDPEVLSKLLDFQSLRRDGHCPSLRGKELNGYAVAGIHSCHESTTAGEASEKLSKGIHVLIREGSCAKDADSLLELLDSYSSATLAFCSDDRNPLDILAQGHINYIINKALRRGQDPKDVFRAASFAAARIYGLNDRGALAPGYKADFCLVRPKNGQWCQGMEVREVWKAGERVGSKDLSQHSGLVPKVKNKNLNLPQPQLRDFDILHAGKTALVRVIEVIPEQILTRHLTLIMHSTAGKIQAAVDEDILKICVFERHHRTAHKSVGFVRGFSIKSGAIATSINHDSHNIIVVGSSDELILAAIEELISIDGGIVVLSSSGQKAQLALPIAGLMTDESPQTVAEHLKILKALAQSIGCTLMEPFLQLSFLALPVIPSLKITDRGLVDVDAFCKVPLIIEDLSNS